MIAGFLVCGRWESNPQALRAQDPKSCVSANFTTSANHLNCSLFELKNQTLANKIARA